MKCWPSVFEGLLSGEKTFEIRLNDRSYQVGDVLHQREWSASYGYTGREVRHRVAYVLAGGMFGLAQGHVAMSLAPLTPAQEWRSPEWKYNLPELLVRAADADPLSLSPLSGDLRAAAEYLRAQRTAAPTPEYVAGWLARGEADLAACLPIVRGGGGYDGDRESDGAAKCRDAIRALAPPSAPPGPEGASNDRLLLLKAILLGRAEAVRLVSGRIRVFPRSRDKDWSEGFTVHADADGMPIFTPELRAALTEATHA